MEGHGKNVPSSLLVIKIYDISLHTLATTEHQELASRFEENATQNLARMMDLYYKSIYDLQRYIQWPKINLKDDTHFLLPSSKILKTIMKRSRWRFKPRK
jgi:hypothetical protein